MKKTKTTFLLAEICLGILLLFCVHLIFEDEKPQKRVAVIVEKSGDEKWNSFMNGLKQAAGIGKYTFDYLPIQMKFENAR